MQKIYVVNGFARSGKTEFGKRVGDELRQRGIPFLHTSSINPVKKVLCAYETWGDNLRNVGNGILRVLKEEVTDRNWSGREEDKDDYWRKAMSDLKAKINEWSPTLIHTMVMDEFKSLGKEFVGFVDIREPENIVGFQNHILQTQRFVDSVETICVTSDKSILFNNGSDMRVYDFAYDIVVENSRDVFVNDSISLSFLKARARTFVEQEILEGRQKERFY